MNAPRKRPSRTPGAAPLTIGQVASRSGIGIETVRFYERQGLIEEPPRKASGYRLFSPEVIDRLRFIKRTRELGFSLPEIADLLSLRVDAATSCDDVRRRAGEKIAEVEARIDDLSRIRRALAAVQRACDERTTSACPLLEALDVRFASLAGPGVDLGS